MMLREKCPVCGSWSRNKHDPMGRPKTLVCKNVECEHVWSVPRYIPDALITNKASRARKGKTMLMIVGIVAVMISSIAYGTIRTREQQIGVEIGDACVITRVGEVCQ